MSSKSHRRWMIALGVMLILGSAASLAMFGVHYEARRTYVRPVHYAQEQGQDPYQVALTCAEEMGADFMTLAVIYSICVTVLAIVIIVLSARRATSPAIGADRGGGILH